MSAFISLLFTPPNTPSNASTSRHPSTSRDSLGSNSRNESSEDTRQCWICFAEEPIPRPFSSSSPSAPKVPDNWVRPCKCSGTTAWVHQSCLLDWMDVKMRAGHPLSQPMSCPQCHAHYNVQERYGLPRPLLSLINAVGRTSDRFLMYAALSMLAATGYGGLFGYGAGVFVVSIGPRDAAAFFHASLGSLTRVESIVKVFLGMPMIAVSILTGAFPSLSWVFPIIPPILYANDVIEWNSLSPKLLTLLLPFSLFAYRLGEVYVPRAILRAFGKDNSADGGDDSTSPSGNTDTNAANVVPSPAALNSPTNTEDSQLSNGTIGLEDERAIRFSVLSTTGVLFLPFISAALGFVLFPRRVLPFYRMLLGGSVIIAGRDILRALAWYQQVLIRPYRRILPYSSSVQ